MRVAPATGTLVQACREEAKGGKKGLE